MEKERFSLLLLEPNEIYFEDFSSDMTEFADGEVQGEVEIISGRLKICSKSIVFDPKDKSKPLIKIPYKDCEKIHTLENPLSKNKSRLVIRCLQYIEMLGNNVLAPYQFIPTKKIFFFLFHFADVNECISQICQLRRASTLHVADQNSMIAAIVFSRHSRVKFNPLWLDNIYEKTLYDCKVDEINPLVLNPGRLLLTNDFIYFQPYNNIQPYPVIKINLKTVTSLITRRFLLRHTGLEIKWQAEEKQILYISFRNPNERNNFFDSLKEAGFQIPSIEPESMTLKWQNHIISNYEYLLYLNSLADRTFQDLTQYPVFPWVIKDYTSNDLNLENENVYRDLTKPIGALNPERLARLKERCDEMAEPKFLYGSHYSTPGFVLFYLVRKFPHLMLCLQNGRFDHPDRMFNSVADTFRNCLLNMSDFKELIPEFYDVEQEGDFLLNSNKINFGLRTDGTVVNHVSLPPWAKSSPKTFVHILRNALESDYVSENLHHWIDLVFGYKQRGNDALKADNLFFHLCYEGSVDLDSIRDPAARLALEVQISEFGQIPKQLFNKPHAARKPKTHQETEKSSSNTLDYNKLCDLELQISYVAHKEAISTIFIDGDIIISTGKDGILKCYKMSQKRQIRSISLGKLPLSTCIKIKNCNVLIIGSWDNTISLYNCDYGKISDVIPAHEDAVSCLRLIDEYGILISGSWDCSVKVWKGFTNINYKSFRISNALIAYLPLEEKVLCLDTKQKSDTIQVAVGVSSGEIFLWNLKICDFPTLRNIHSSDPQLLVMHSNKITSLAFNESGTKLASCSSNLLSITDVETGMDLLKRNFENIPLCLEWCGDSDTLLIGDATGVISIWDLSEGKLKCDRKLSDGPLTCIKYLPARNIIVTAGRDNNDNLVKCWSPT